MTTGLKNLASPAGRLPEVEFQKLLSAIRQEYVRLLPVKVAEMESIWKMQLREAWAPERNEQLIRLAHSLAGSAGSYGYPHISKNARALELFLKETPGDAPPTPDDIRTVRELLSALRVDKWGGEQGTVVPPEDEAPRQMDFVSARHDKPREISRCQDFASE